MRNGPLLKGPITREHGYGQIDGNGFTITRHEEAHDEATNQVGGQIREEGTTGCIRRSWCCSTRSPVLSIPTHRIGLVTGQAKQFFCEPAKILAHVAKESQRNECLDVSVVVASEQGFRR